MSLNNFQNIDLVIPVFNEKNNILPLIDYTISTLSSVFRQINFIFVDDGSTDDTETLIQQLTIQNAGVKLKYIRLSRNHGKDLAIKCGLDNSSSFLCAIIDGDFQHPPDKIIEAVEKIKEGFNIVNIEKREYSVGSTYKRIGSFLFHKIINLLSGNEMPLSDFKLLDIKAVNIIKEFKEINYFNRGIVSLIGLKSANIAYVPNKRTFGTSKYSLNKLIGLAVDSLISVSVRPLRVSIYCGLIMSTISFIYGLYILIEKIFMGQPIPGFATLGAALFFLGGIQLLFLGIIGEYIGKTFMESKKRPQYIVDYIKDVR